MIIAVVIFMLFITCFAVMMVAAWLYDPLDEYEPVTDEELLLLTVVDEKYYVDLLDYVRTLRMSPELQDYLKDRKESLESISYFLLTQMSMKEQEKRERFEMEARQPSNRPLTRNDRIILKRLGK